MNRPRILPLALAFAIVALSLAPSVAWPHGVPLDLAIWGPFGETTVHCQRMLGRAARRCFELVLSAQRQCMDTQLADAQCDTAQRDADIDAAESASQAVPMAQCFTGNLTELHFFSGFEETQADVMRGCAQAGPVTSMIYGPAPAAGSTASVDPATQRCLTGVSSRSQMFARFVLRLNTHALDHIAVNIPFPSKKLTLMRGASMRIGAARQRLGAQLQQICPNFTALYGQDPITFLTAVQARADCVVAATYVQDAVACKPICGDGVVEPGEQCDDGNTISGDGCSGACTLEATTSIN